MSDRSIITQYLSEFQKLCINKFAKVVHLEWGIGKIVISNTISTTYLIVKNEE